MELQCTGIANGGDAVSRAEDGRVVFVRRGLPGERVSVRFTHQARDFARAVVTHVFEASAMRQEPTCPHVASGCGGCGWQHVAFSAQHELKRAIVVEALERIGKLVGVDARVTNGPLLGGYGYRTTVRALVENGRVGFRSEQSNDAVEVDSCEVTDPVLEYTLMHSNFGPAREVTVRRGTVTGEVMVIVDPSPDGVCVVTGHSVASLRVVGVAELADDDQPFFHEMIRGHRFRISAGAFFQTRHDGTELLVQLVDDALRSFDAPPDVLADLYGGVGLFAVTLGERFTDVVSVEREGCSSRDAAVNLATFDNSRAVASDVADFDLSSYARGRSTLVVADPARAGLGRTAVERIVACEPRGVVLVSCDAASLGRDAALLAAAGYRLRSSVVVDMFPHTPHVEVVSCFDPPL